MLITLNIVALSRTTGLGPAFPEWRPWMYLSPLEVVASSRLTTQSHGALPRGRRGRQLGQRATTRSFVSLTTETFAVLIQASRAPIKGHIMFTTLEDILLHFVCTGQAMHLVLDIMVIGSHVSSSPSITMWEEERTFIYQCCVRRVYSGVSTDSVKYSYYVTLFIFMCLVNFTMC